ncbi:hypothetical protein ACFYY8_18570 [Streptosporangium sp. NPDC001559]|uniref:hypothetical protein n=1 Tax=Streptosporangium sp. NPDC001559 TaxID=3366187 RepID=UPI0036E86A0B
MLRTRRWWIKGARATALQGYLLGHTHGLLDRLLDAAVDAEASSTPAASEGEGWVMVRLGGLFRLAADEGLLPVRQPARQ